MNALSTKIRGHPEGESALGASVACWKAAGWRQAKGKYIILENCKKIVCVSGVLTSVYAFEISVSPQGLTGMKLPPGLEEEVGWRPKG